MLQTRLPLPLWHCYIYICSIIWLSRKIPSLCYWASSVCDEDTVDLHAITWRNRACRRCPRCVQRRSYSLCWRMGDWYQISIQSLKLKLLLHPGCSMRSMTYGCVCTVWSLRAGMTGTRSFHDSLLACADDGGSACRWQLRERLLLPNWPTSRLELFVFQKPQKQKSKSKATEEKDRSESDLKPRGERETRSKTNLIPRPGQVSAAGFGIRIVAVGGLARLRLLDFWFYSQPYSYLIMIYGLLPQ